MKRLPEDFRINVLLPGAVWLLASALIGRAAVARMGTDTITVILFAVITLVVFVIPMAVYMEYRGKIEECVSRHKPKRTLPAEDCRRTDKGTEIAVQPPILPQDFPDALKGGKTLALLDALRREGFLNDEYRPCKGCNATQMAFIADCIAAICNISYRWKTFGNYWRLPNLRQLLGAKDRRGSKMEKEDIIIDILKKAAEADGEICGTNAYRRWLKSVQG
ncbi:hypothetical protein [Bacteroides cellulosilyticus]|uniref:hypothetical protein n=1 Tax=Bacteroides cellulosilyticus TaxID=246787 RepID=UPI00101C9A4E|nr:hypothetical protein [Bacteroides cellulosilyticus]